MPLIAWIGIGLVVWIAFMLAAARWSRRAWPERTLPR
jgi:hypothetical protein